MLLSDFEIGSSEQFFHQFRVLTPQSRLPEDPPDAQGLIGQVHLVDDPADPSALELRDRFSDGAQAAHGLGEFAGTLVQPAPVPSSALYLQRTNTHRRLLTANLVRRAQNLPAYLPVTLRPVGWLARPAAALRRPSVTQVGRHPRSKRPLLFGLSASFPSCVDSQLAG